MLRLIVVKAVFHLIPPSVNDNLEQQAQSYFQELFVDNDDPELSLIHI